MKKIILIILYILLIIALLFGLLCVWFGLLLGNLGWLIILSILLLISVFFTKKKWRNLPIVMILLIVAIIGLISLGSRDRNGTYFEKKYIINHLEEKYNISNIEIIDLKFSNEELTGWDNLLRINMFKWNNFQATIKDSAGYEFEVYGYNEGFNNITSIVDNYFVLGTMDECKLQYGDSVYDINIRLDDGIDDDWLDYYVRLSYHVNYEDISKDEFDETKELIYINNIKTKILDYKFTDDIRVTVYYELKDGTIMYYKKDRHNYYDFYSE